MFDTTPGLQFHDLAHGVSNTVTPVGGAAVAASVIWRQEDDVPAGQQVGAAPSGTANSRDLAYVRRAHVPNLPLGSTIVGGPAHLQKTWRVHSLIDRSDPDYHVAVCV